MKKSTFVLFLFISFFKPASSQDFELFNLPKLTRHVPFTRFEVHKDTLFFFLESSLTGDHYLGKFSGTTASGVALPKGLFASRYHMVSFRGQLYMVLKNTSNALFLYRYDGSIFEKLQLPEDYAFGSFDEMEVYDNALYVGLTYNLTKATELFRWDDTTFHNVPLCADCFIGLNPGTNENARDEMIVFKNRLYIGGYLALDSVRWIHPERLLVYDGVTMGIIEEPWVQWSAAWDQEVIYDDVLQTESGEGYDGTGIVPIAYHYPVVSGVDPVAKPWAAPIGDALGKSVYNNAVYTSGYLPFFDAEDEFLRRRFFSFSTDPAKAKEIFLPAGYYFSGRGFFTTNLQAYACRLFMFVDHDSGGQRLAAYQDSPFTICGFSLPLISIPLKFTVYPNPGNGVFTVDIPKQALGAFEVQAFNSDGKCILEKTIDQNNNQVDLREFGRGVYMLHISNGNPIRAVVN